METVKLSLGKIKAFIACPLKYKLAYVDQVDGDKKPGAALSFYKSLHGALQYFHKRGTSNLPSFDDLLELLERNWASEGYRDRLEGNQFKTQAQEILRRFYRDFAAAPPKVRYVDVPVSFQTRTASVSSRADRVDLLEDGTYEVINYKTGKNTLEPDELARDLQAAVLFQGANADKHLHGRVSKVSFYFLRANRKVSVTPPADDLKAANALIDQTVTSIARMTRPPTLLDKALRRHSPLEHPEALAEKGPLCSTCEYLAACPAWPITPLTLSQDTPERFSERLRLSYSKLSSYQRCPRAWKKVYLDGCGTRSRPFFSFGTAVHDALERFYNPECQGKLTRAALLELWERSFSAYQEGYADPEEARRYHDQGVEMFERYFARYVEGGKFRPAFKVEEYFELPVGKNAVMTGFIDRIDLLEDGAYGIVDYKTEPSRRTQQQVDEDDQLTIYFLACESLFRLKISRLALQMLAHDEEMVTHRRREDIPEVLAGIDATAGEIKDKIKSYQTAGASEESEFFPPRKNRYCKTCDYLDTCALRADIMGDSELSDAEYAEDAPVPEEYD